MNMASEEQGMFWGISRAQLKKPIENDQETLLMVPLITMK